MSEGMRDTITGYDFKHDEPLACAKAIRERCLHCVGGHHSEVRRCTARTPEHSKERHADPQGCHLWPYRHGKGKDTTRGPVKDSRLRSIRKECLNCMNGSSVDVKDCESSHCHLWPYREGRNPNLVGKRGASPEHMARIRQKSAVYPEESTQG